MINFNEIKVGDYLIANYEGDRKEGEVIELNGSEKQVCVDVGAQSFWYETDQLSPIPLDEPQLFKLKFKREDNPDGTIKYMKGAFRILIPGERDFSRMEIWYRDETRHITHPIPVHVLQNHYQDMTKVILDDTEFE